MPLKLSIIFSLQAVFSILDTLVDKRSWQRDHLYKQWIFHLSSNPSDPVQACPYFADAQVRTKTAVKTLLQSSAVEKASKKLKGT